MSISIEQFVLLAGLVSVFGFLLLLSLLWFVQYVGTFRGCLRCGCELTNGGGRCLMCGHALRQESLLRRWLEETAQPDKAKAVPDDVRGLLGHAPAHGRTDLA